MHFARELILFIKITIAKMEENTPTVSLVSCMHFVRRGVAKAVPEKVC